MNGNFYPSHQNELSSHDGPLVPTIIKSSPEVVTSTLPTGNQVTESLQVTATLRRWRNHVINKIDLARAEWETQKSAARNEIASADEYLQKNVLTDIYENREWVVPSSILSLGAFFCGRVLSNPMNWGNKNSINILNSRPSVLGKVCTSIPSRLLLPFILAGTVFKQLTPITARNIWDTVQRDVLPKKVVDDSHRLWREYYIDGILKRKQVLCQSVDDTLQRNIKHLRKSIIDRSK